MTNDTVDDVEDAYDLQDAFDDFEKGVDRLISKCDTLVEHWDRILEAFDVNTEAMETGQYVERFECPDDPPCGFVHRRLIRKTEDDAT